MKKLTPWIKSAIFLVLLAVLLKGCDYIFAQTGYVRFIINEVEKEETSYDTVILGASHCRSAIDPAKLDETLGTCAVNMAIPGETVKDSYYLLKDIVGSSDIKTVILDVDYQYWVEEQPTAYFTESFIYQQLRNPFVKAEYLIRNSGGMDMRNVIASRLSWDVSISGVQRNVSIKMSDSFKNVTIESAYAENGIVEGADGPYVGAGFFYRAGTEYGKMPIGEEYLKTWIGRSQNNLDENVKNTFIKIVKFCQDNDIRLICVTSPITPSAVEILQMQYAHDSFTAFITEECGIEYYDFNNLLMSYLPRSDCDYGDQEGHMGGELAEVYSERLAEFLSDAADGDYIYERYFYQTFEDMYEKMREDYTAATGREWRGI